MVLLSLNIFYNAIPYLDRHIEFRSAIALCIILNIKMFPKIHENSLISNIVDKFEEEPLIIRLQLLLHRS